MNMKEWSLSIFQQFFALIHFFCIYSAGKSVFESRWVVTDEVHKEKGDGRKKKLFVPQKDLKKKVKVKCKLNKHTQKRKKTVPLQDVV